MLSFNNYFNKLFSTKKGFHFIAAVKNIPHPSKAHFGGEDAYFINNETNVVGVADGVGGWADVKGANAAKYSRDLMSNCSISSNLETNRKILQKGFDMMDKNLLGSTTAVLAAVRSDNLDILNLGDSGCSLFRGNRFIFETKTQTHGFNFPLQLGPTSKDSPKDADETFIKASVGDILVLATDGVWDNIWVSDIENEIKRALRLSNYEKIAQEIANTIGEMAAKNGANQRYDSPFAAEARRAGYNYIGGKLDDVTVVAAIVSE